MVLPAVAIDMLAADTTGVPSDAINVTSADRAGPTSTTVTNNPCEKVRFFLRGAWELAPVPDQRLSTPIRAVA